MAKVLRPPGFYLNAQVGTEEISGELELELWAETAQILPASNTAGLGGKNDGEHGGAGALLIVIIIQHGVSFITGSVDQMAEFVLPVCWD